MENLEESLRKEPTEPEKPWTPGCREAIYGTVMSTVVFLNFLTAVITPTLSESELKEADKKQDAFFYTITLPGRYIGYGIKKLLKDD